MKSIKLVSAALQKCKSGLPAFGKTTEQPRIIVHIPHSSTNIPKVFQQEFLPEKEKLHSELLCMTDWYTDELFACPGCLAVVHQFSRLARNGSWIRKMKRCGRKAWACITRACQTAAC